MLELEEEAIVWGVSLLDGRVGAKEEVDCEAGVEDGGRGEDGAGRVECCRVSCIPEMHHGKMVHVHDVDEGRSTMDDGCSRHPGGAGASHPLHACDGLRPSQKICDRRNKFAAVASNLRQLATGVKNSNYEKRESLGRDIFRSVFLRNFEEHIFLKAGVRSDIKRLNDVFLLFC